MESQNTDFYSDEPIKLINVSNRFLKLWKKCFKLGETI